MNKEQKVISQPLAKKIHDKAKDKGFELPESERVCKGGYFAFDCAELGEIMDFSDVSYYRNLLNYFAWFQGENDGEKIITAKTMAEAMGKMFYYLLDNDLL